jgi:hypothetical protein
MVAKLMQDQPAARYQTPAELIRDLDAVEHDRPILA